VIPVLFRAEVAHRREKEASRQTHAEREKSSDYTQKKIQKSIQKFSFHELPSIEWKYIM
jgi:hypothetical protein